MRSALAWAGLVLALACCGCSQSASTSLPPSPALSPARPSVPATNAVASSLGQITVIQPRAASGGTRGIVPTVVVASSDTTSVSVVPTSGAGQSVLRLRLDPAAITSLSHLMRYGDPFVDVFASLPYPHEVGAARITHPVVDSGFLEVRLTSGITTRP